MRRTLLVLVLALAVVTLGGCAKDTTTSTSSTTTSTAVGTTSTAAASSTTTTAAGKGGSYCEVISRINDTTTKKDKGNGKASQAEIDQVLGDLKAARAAGPDELHDAWDTLTTGATKLAKLPDSADPSDALAIVMDPAFQEAVTKLNDYTKKTCGFPIEGFDQGDSNGTTTGTGGLSTSCNDLVGTPGPNDDPKTSLAAVRSALCEANKGASWVKPLVGYAAWSSQGGDEPQWAVIVPSDQTPPVTVSADDALAACKALETYLRSVDVDAAITIGSAKMDDLPKADTVLAAKKPGGACAING